MMQDVGRGSKLNSKGPQQESSLNLRSNLMQPKLIDPNETLACGVPGAFQEQTVKVGAPQKFEEATKDP